MLTRYAFCQALYKGIAYKVMSRAVGVKNAVGGSEGLQALMGT